MEDDFNFDMFEGPEADGDDIKQGIIVVVGRARDRDEFRESVDQILDNNRHVHLDAVVPLGLGVEEIRSYVGYVHVTERADTTIEGIAATFQEKMWQADVFENGILAAQFVEKEYGEEMFGEMTQHPFNGKDQEKWAILQALFEARPDRLNLTRGMLDGKPIPLISHITHLGTDIKVTPFAILLTDELLSRIINPLK